MRPWPGTAPCCVVAATIALAPASPAAAKVYPGVAPTPLFATPERAAYCSVDATSAEDHGAELECWRPRDGFFITIPWRASRGDTDHVTARPRFVHGLRVLKGFRPRAPVLRFGGRWQWRCRDPGEVRTCSRTVGAVTFTCVSRPSGLTCTNLRGRRFWVGRTRGHRFLRQ
jgi:hypothetical protein